MLKHLRTRIVWLTAGLVLGGSALAFAGVSTGASHGPTPKPSVSATASEDTDQSTEAPEPADTEAPKPSSSAQPTNHGFYVSQAAACQDVNDTVNGITFTAPADCATNGQAHGQYVSQVARSAAGKTDHGGGNANSHANKGS
ncbi:MAG: hypothetical protein ACXVQY_08965 [Actinomycetota bacterium]